MKIKKSIMHKPFVVKNTAIQNKTEIYPCLTLLPLLHLDGKFLCYVSKFPCGLNGQEDLTLTLYVTVHGSYQ